MTDKLILSSISCQSHIGVSDGERQNPQEIFIDLELGIDAARAARRDDINDAIDYEVLVNTLREYLSNKSFRLIETIADELSHMILKNFDASYCLIKVKKRALSGVDSCSVEVYREK
jgi:7,8-dihydroneopterin aldolase/epimerase/oxygenase